MFPTVIAWALGLYLLVVSVLEAAKSWGWRKPGANPVRTNALSGLLDVACVAVFFRLIVDWGTAPPMLWGLSAVAIALAAGGLVWRWNELRPRDSGGAKGGAKRVIVRLIVLAALIGANWFAG